MRLRRRVTGRRLPRGASSPAAAPDARPSHWRMRCMCGMILEISLEDDGKRQTCETCRRRYDIHLTEDVTTGQKGVSLLYLTDENRASGETSTVGSGTTSFQLPAVNPASN